MEPRKPAPSRGSFTIGSPKSVGRYPLSHSISVDGNVAVAQTEVNVSSPPQCHCRCFEISHHSVPHAATPPPTDPMGRAVHTVGGTPYVSRAEHQGVVEALNQLRAAHDALYDSHLALRTKLSQLVAQDSAVREITSRLNALESMQSYVGPPTKRSESQSDGSPGTQFEATSRIDTPSVPPSLEIPRRQSSPLGANRDMSALPSSIFATASNIETLGDIKYHEGVRSPTEDLKMDETGGTLETQVNGDLTSKAPKVGAAFESGATNTDSPQNVDRKIRALLNKMTMKKFDSISDQIIGWVNKSENERDGRTLIQVIRLVFEKATGEAAYTEMYARLCRKMMETISPDVQDHWIRNAEGKPIAGGQLFRKYLLNRCQEDFEYARVAKETTIAVAGDESELYSDATQKAKRGGLGLIKFIGELFKLQMLTERIMHECVKKLLGRLDNVEHPEEEEMESLCQLLKTVGQLLDVQKARAHMDIYFTRMKELCKSPNVSPRMQFMLQDVIELRDRKWVARSAIIAPTTISAVHEAAAKEKAAAEAQNHRQHTMSRGGSRRGGDRNVESGPDGWTTAVTRPQPKAGDLSQFGKISKAAPMVMGPSSVFTKKDPKRDSLSRTNMFSMRNPELAVDTGAARPSRPPSRKPLGDLGQGGAPESQRRKLQLLPRTKPTSTEETPPPASEDEPEEPVQMSESDARKKIDEDVKEFFAVRSMEEADVYFTNLAKEHRFLLVDKLVGSALESKEADAALVAEFFTRAGSKGQCSSEVFEAGFMPMAELLDDIAIDAPNAFKFMAIMLKGAGFDKDELARLAGKSMDSDRLLQLVTS